VLQINYFKADKIPKSVSFTLCYPHCEFSYIPHFNQRNALIKTQQNITENTLHVRYQLLHVSTTFFHP